MIRWHAIVRLRLASTAQVLGEVADVVCGRHLESEADQSEGIVAMNMRNADQLNGRNRPKSAARSLLALVLAAAATSLAPQESATAMLQVGLRIRNAASATAKPNQADEPRFLVQAARVPIFVDIDLGGAGGTPAVPDDAVDRIVAALDANPRRLITLRFQRGALCFNALGRSTRDALLEKKGSDVIDAYNDYMAGQVRDLLANVTKARPGGPVSVQGIPFEGRATAVASANRAYGPVIEPLSAIVLGGGMMISGSGDEVAMLRRAYPHALAVAGDRAIIFLANGGWRIATTSAGVEEGTLASGDVETQGLQVEDRPSEVMASDSPDGLPDEVDVLGSPTAGEVSSDGAVAEFQTLPPDAGGSGSGSSGSAPVGSGGNGGTYGDGGAAGGTTSGAAAATNVNDESNDGEVAAGTSNADADSQEHDSNDADADVSETDDSRADDSDGWDPSDEVDDSLGGESSEDDPVAGDGDDSGGTEDDDPLNDNSADDDDASDFSDDVGEGGAGDSEGSSNGVEGGDGDADGVSLLTGGDGFDGLTAQPSRFGLPGSLGFEERSIARWASVPFRAFIDGVAAFHVVADHIAGIAYVDFSLDGGSWKRISEAVWIEELQSDGFVASIDVAALEEGVHEIRAIVVPHAGDARVLQGEISHQFQPPYESSALTGEHSMYFSVLHSADVRVVHVSNDGSDEVGTGTVQSPYRTIEHAAWIGLAGGVVGADVSHCRILLHEGTYTVDGFGWPKSSLETGEGWLTLAAADPEEPPVLIGPGSRIPFRLLAVENVVLDARGLVGDYVLNGHTDARLWINSCTLEGGFNVAGGFQLGFNGGVWAEDSVARDVHDTPFGHVFAARCRIDGVLVDAFRSRGLFDCVVTRQWAGQTTELADPHPDVYQIFHADGFIDNVIIRSLEATDQVFAQGLFFSGHTAEFRNLSIRGVRIDNTYSGAMSGFLNFSAIRPFRHMLLNGCSFNGGFLATPDNPYGLQGEFSSQGCRFSNCVWLDDSGPFMPFPDGPGAGGAWPGYWNGTLPWVSPWSGISYVAE